MSNQIMDSMSIEPDDNSRETICSCGHPKSSHNLYGCACGCNISSMTLDDFGYLEDEIDALRAKLDEEFRLSEIRFMENTTLSAKLKIAKEVIKKAKYILGGSTTQEELANLYDNMNEALQELEA